LLFFCGGKTTEEGDCSNVSNGCSNQLFNSCIFFKNLVFKLFILIKILGETDKKHIGFARNIRFLSEIDNYFYLFRPKYLFVWRN